MQTLPPISSLSQSPQLRASKWTCLQALVTPQEMQVLLEALSQPYLYLCGSLWAKEEFSNHKKLFLENYKRYIDALENGNVPDLSLTRTFFSACLTDHPEATYLQDVQNEQFLLRFTQPIIQIQHHTMNYSPYDGKMHSMVFGKDAITWGIQLSYPQMYMDANGNVKQTTDSTAHPNSGLFKTLQRWLRHNTLPTTFISDNQRIPTSIRLGKGCLEWIERHPQMQAHNIQVARP